MNTTIGGQSETQNIVNMVEIAEKNYTKELKKVTYYVKEIVDILKSDIREDLLLA